ncbi:hypothetical protein KSD_23540 [Ktedonobacter sp. SOSP1-85]|uniref:serine/threonine protein kinase n=1 Tax=Ktedonobacter sp. SOSP1-85 TaxID=2778367 RepID=UPI00191629F7|nr:serine/threonine-protein kinase [Ktedonobacter sp. SOSP1-85]GHO74583.1 hypothetical protein KSD_23540 [Ktedonobacter sp. SOSP1-85]
MSTQNQYFPEPGTLEQLGSYHLLRPLRRGGYATIYLGEHQYLHTPGAVKVLNTWFATGRDTQRFLAEATVQARLRHPHIVRVLDFGVEERIPFLVMEYAPHGTLQDRFPQQSQVALDVVLPYVLQLGAALQYMHDNGVLHCDVKPQNVLLGPQEEVWLCDFGIATSVLKHYQEAADVSNGTALYAAPEQIHGRPEPASDQYALGIMLYTWLCGHFPFSGSTTQVCHQHLYILPEPIRVLMPEVPIAIERVVMRALAKEPARRFPDIAAFMKALQQAVHSRPTLSRGPLKWARSLLNAKHTS